MEHYILTVEQVAALYEYVEEKLEESGCDHTRKHTLKWLEENIPADQREALQPRLRRWAATATARF